MANAVLTPVGFVIVIASAGLVTSPAVLLAVPASVLVGSAFRAGGLAVTMLLPDVADFPGPRACPRAPQPLIAGPVGYLLVFGAVAMGVATGRVARIMLR